MEWIPLDITIPADREAVALALYRAGYTVRQRRRKNSLKSRAIAVFETRRYESVGREVKRVPLDFDHPLGKVWYGYQVVFCHEEYEDGCERCKEFARIMGIPPKLYKNIPNDDPCPDWRKYFKVDPPEGEGYQLWEHKSHKGRMAGNDSKGHDRGGSQRRAVFVKEGPMKPIYKPKGAAAEYGDYAVNIYTGCPHRCYYCFAPQVLHRDREAFHSCVEPRKDIVREVRRQLEREQITGKLVHLCFTCDPYPTGYDTTPTREVIKALKEYGNHVQILTKGDGSRDFDLLDGGDWYGVTISCDNAMAYAAEPGAVTPDDRLLDLNVAKCRGVNTWVSFEPVLDPAAVLDCIKGCAYFIDRVKIGKLNYHPSGIDWAKFGREAEAACEEMGLDCYIKDSLRAEMEKG